MPVLIARRAGIVASVCWLMLTLSVAHAEHPSKPMPRGGRFKDAQKPALVAATAATVKHARGVQSMPESPPSFRWAILHNWLYFLSLGFNAVNVQYLARTIVNGNLEPSPAAIALSGKVESVDKMLTFLGVGLLAALSDVYGRKPLMVWAALGFGLTNLIQSRATSAGALYLADLIDGCSSCMTPVCQAYVTDCSPPGLRASNLGIFQGISIGMAFIIAFPVGGVLCAKLGPRVPLQVAAALQLLNALLLVFVTPEANPRSARAGRTLDLRQANPLGGLRRLFGRADLLRAVAASYFLVSLARNALDAQFVNYASIRFGWSQQQTGPVMVIVGLMLAIAPRLLVARLGLRRALLNGLLLFACGLVATGIAPTAGGFVAGVFVVSVGCVAIPALQALLANLAPVGERGAVLGALGSLTELTGAIGSTLCDPTPTSCRRPCRATPPLPGHSHSHSHAALLPPPLPATPSPLTCVPHSRSTARPPPPRHPHSLALALLVHIHTPPPGARLARAGRYAAVLATFTGDSPPLPLPGMHFFVGASFLLAAYAMARHAFATYPEAAARATSAAPADGAATM